MKYFLLPIILFIPMLGTSQYFDTTFSKKMTLGVIANPNIGYRTLNTDSSWLNWLIDLRDAREIPAIGYSFGFFTEVNTFNWLSVEIAAVFSDKRYKLKEIQIGNTSFIPNSKTIHYQYNRYYIDVPIKVNFTFLTLNKGQKKTSFFIAAGGDFNLFLYSQNKFVVKESNKIIESLKGSRQKTFEKFGYSFLGSLGVNYDFSYNWRLRIEPNIHYSKTAILDAPILEYIYFGGVNVGLSYRLK